MPELKTLRTAVAGIGGFAGGELARLLLAHPRLQGTPPLFLGRVADESPTGKVPLEHLHPQLALGAGRTLPPVEAFSWQLIHDRQIDLVFLALPHENSREWTPEWLAHGVKVVDLSGAWRLQDPANRAVYKLTDADPERARQLQTEAVFGCPELHREAIAAGHWRQARLVANPGCYSTSVMLALAPLLRAGLLDLDHGIIADSKSGVSGAGKAPTATTHFMHAADNLSAYALHKHRHTGELLEQLHLRNSQIQFTPHLLPIPRGILSTIYANLNLQAVQELLAKSPASETKVEKIQSSNIPSAKPYEFQSQVTRVEKTLRDCIMNFYASSPLVRIAPAGTLPEIQQSVRTNYCDLGLSLAPDGRRLILVSCLDNLLKGASGQAVQNMNLMCGWPEEEGLV